jgi:TonB family protein
VDRERRLVRNSQVHDQAAQFPSSTLSPARDSAVMVDVVVLSGDLSLFEAIRHAVGERNPVWRARSAEESVELLLTGRCGVLLIDMAAVSTQPATLVEQIVEQFPDLVVVVAGRRDDETLLARLISDGLVYRFMHKPLSPRRAGMFLNAAIRSHVERRENRSLAPLLPLMGGLRTRIELRKWLFVTAGLALFLLLLALLLFDDRPAASPARAPVAAAPGRPAAPVPPRPIADPVLSGARAALAAGRYEAPAGRNALDLYAAVLLARPANPEARAGLDETTARLVAMASNEAQAGDLDEARRLVARVLAVDPDHASARALKARLDMPPAPVTEPPASLAEAPARADAKTAAALPTTPAGPPAVPPVPATQPAAVVAAPVAKPDIDRATPVRVMPDPLTPRFAAPVAAQSSRATSNRGSNRTFGPPIVSGHPTAGYTKPLPAPEPITQPDPAMPDRDLEQLTATEPVYPPEALRNRVEGWVEVDFTVTEAGVVREIEIVAAEPRGVFEAAATAAVGQWRFQPRVVNGRPVPQRSSVRLRFNVEG